MLIVIVCELLFTKSCLMTFVAHGKTDFCTVLFYSLRDVRMTCGHKLAALERI